MGSDKREYADMEWAVVDVSPNGGSGGGGCGCN